MDDYTENKATHLHLQEHPQTTAAAEEADQEADEDLSLSGLILNSDKIEFQDRSRSSTSDPPEIFEFFSNLNSSEIKNNMSHAEDIIFCGKLMTYEEKNHHHDNSLKHPTINQARKSLSFNDLRIPRSNSAKNQQYMRTSRSLDYQKLYGSSAASATVTKAEKVEIERSSSIKSTGIKEKIPRPPRWYMMFGFLKFPPEMAYQDIKSRQVRRNTGSLFTSLDAAAGGGGDGGGKAIVSRGDDRKWSSGSWDLLSVLSCKDHASVAVTTPFGRPQQI